jgi:hypothetical protein
MIMRNMFNPVNRAARYTCHYCVESFNEHLRYLNSSGIATGDLKCILERPQLGGRNQGADIES